MQENWFMPSWRSIFHFAPATQQAPPSRIWHTKSKIMVHPEHIPPKRCEYHVNPQADPPLFTGYSRYAQVQKRLKVREYLRQVEAVSWLINAFHKRKGQFRVPPAAKFLSFQGHILNQHQVCTFRFTVTKIFIRFHCNSDLALKTENGSLPQS